MSESLTGGTQSGSVRLDVEGRIATLLLDRPAKLNALTPEMLQELDRHLATVEASESVHLVLLRAAGDRAFCVGADINRFADLQPVDMWRTWTARGHAAFDRLARLRQPVVAVLHGDAFGGGLELALAADFRVVAEQVRLGMSEAEVVVYHARLSEIDPMQVIREAFSLIYRMNLRLPTRYVLLDKAVATVGSVGVDLYPDFNVFEVARDRKSTRLNSSH